MGSRGSAGSPADGGVYIHGTDADEQHRLSRLNDLLNARCVAEIRPEPGERVLDLGSGLGQLSRAIARATGARVVGVEYSPEQIEEASRQARADAEEHLVEFRRGDAANPPLAPAESGTFDLAHTRFVLEHVTDPLAVVRAMVAAVRPGGRIVLADDDHDVLRLHPVPPGVHEVWSAYIRLYDRLGRDPFIGRRLVSLLKQAGALPVRNTWVWFGACSGNDEFEPVVRNMMRILEGARSALIDHALTDAATFDRAINGLTEFLGRDDAAVWFSMALAEGREPGTQVR